MNLQFIHSCLDITDRKFAFVSTVWHYFPYISFFRRHFSLKILINLNKDINVSIWSELQFLVEQANGSYLRFFYIFFSIFLLQMSLKSIIDTNFFSCRGRGKTFPPPNTFPLPPPTNKSQNIHLCKISIFTLWMRIVFTAHIIWFGTRIYPTMQCQPKSVSPSFLLI